MRQFTKEHNDLDWLFPNIDPESDKSSEELFDMFETDAEYFFNLAHTDNEKFDKDDLIDAFMKGASDCQRSLMSLTSYIILQQDWHKKYDELNKKIWEEREIIATNYSNMKKDLDETKKANVKFQTEIERLTNLIKMQ